MKCIGIDVGRDSVKVVTARNKLEFKARVGEWRDRKITFGGNYEVEIDGEKYFIADLVEESFFGRQILLSSKVQLETRVLFLSALALTIEDQDNFTVNTGIPIQQYTPENISEILTFLSGNYQVRINQEYRQVNVQNINIAAEGEGAYWDYVLDENGKIINNRNFSKKDIIRVIDIGSRTINFCTVASEKLLDRDSGTLSYGILELTNAMGDEDMTIEDIKEDMLIEFTRRIIGDLSRKWLSRNLKKNIVILSGGGAILLQKYLRSYFPVVIVSNDPVFANARGFYKMCASKHNT